MQARDSHEFLRGHVCHIPLDCERPRVQSQRVIAARISEDSDNGIDDDFDDDVNHAFELTDFELDAEELALGEQQLQENEAIVEKPDKPSQAIQSVLNLD